MKEALLEPTRLFASARLDRGAAQIGFALLTASAGSVIGELLGLLISGNQQAAREQALALIPADSPMAPAMHRLIDLLLKRPTAGMVILQMICAPLIWFVVLYLSAAVTHGVAALIGQSKRGFPATFAACAYAFAPLALAAVPACGSTIGILWLIVLTGIGMKVTHRISSKGAAASALLPYLLCCCLIVVLGIASVAMVTKSIGTP